MKKERIFWGILFILAGIFLVVNKLGYFPDVNLLSLILTVFLAAVIFRSVMYRDFAGILFPIAFLCIIYDKQLGITAITPWTVLLAALFGSIGLSIIFPKHYNRSYYKYKNGQYFKKSDIKDESNVTFDNSFGTSIKYVNTDAFEKANFSCSFGALKVYFDNAVMKGSRAVVRVDASFSGVELYLPKTWGIDDKTSVFLGSVSEKNRGSQLTTNTLTLIGDISFSGVEIIYV